MNEYEQKQEARKEYYKQKAEQARQEYDQAHDRADEISGAIPFGQPILVGHHSEKRHRQDLDRIDRNMRKALDAAEKAQHYEQKAQSVGKGGVSSDDPEAIRKLKEKLNALEQRREMIKAIRKAMRNKDARQAIAQLEELGLTYEQIQGLYRPDVMGNVGIPAYELTNLGGRIKSTKERIEKLQAQAKRETKEHTINGIEVIENADANRLQIFFPGKPEKEIRDELKSSGFRWSPSNGCWQAYLNNRSIYQAKRILERIIT